MFSNNTNKQNVRAPYNNRGYPAGSRRQDYRPPLQHQQQHYQQRQQLPSTSWGFTGDEYAAYDYPPPEKNPYRQQTGQFTGKYGQGRDRQMHYREPEVNYNRQPRPRLYPDRVPSQSDRSDEREHRSYKEHRHLPKDVPPPNRNSIDPKVYNCPGCKCPYYFAGGRISGKVPLILNCKHTVCQECILKGAKNNNILCPLCQKPSVLQNKNSIDNLSEVFMPNYHIIGVISFSRCVTNNQLTLVPAEELPNKKHNNTSVGLLSAAQLDNEETCCFISCNKTAWMRCDDCNDVYCKECSVVVHKSAKSLWSHKPKPISKKKPSRELDICSEHNMDVEYLCTECEIGACCYCVIEKHTGHPKEDISKLSDEDLCQVMDNTGKLKRIFKQLLASQKRLRDLCNPETTAAEKKICDYFANLHGDLECVEKSLRKKATDFEGSLVSPDDQMTLTMNINQSIAKLRSLIQDCEQVGGKKLNFKKLKEDVDLALQTPCHLLTDDKEGMEPVSFQVDPVVGKLEDCFDIKIMEMSGLRLVTAEELPPDYEIKSVDLESDLDMSITSLDLADSYKKKPITKKQNASKLKTVKSCSLDNELVEVTHIESLECFYVQIKKMQGQLRQLQNDINNFIKMADNIEHPQINELYLALYTNKHEKMWGRGRLTEIKNGETEPLYEIFFIDYGSSQTMDISKLREITSPLAQPKPFAIQCQLFNPGYKSWKKNAHVYMGKMINGKDIYITLKDKSNSVNIVDLLVSSSDRSLTSLVDILIHTCGNGKNLDSSSESSQMQGYTSEHKIFSNSKTFEKNQVDKVLIAKVVDPDIIYIHLEENVEALKKLSGSLRSHFKNAKNNTLLIEGTYVVVENRDSIRGNWHRALIKKVDFNQEMVNVFLIDWGFHITVPWNRVRMIKVQWTAMEAQAIRVKLAHVEPTDKTGSWTDHAIYFLEKYYQSRETLRMRVHEAEPLEVALFQINGNIDICINSLLVKEKLAHSAGPLSTKLEWPTDKAAVVPFSEETGLVESLLAKVELSDSADSADDDPTAVRQRISIVKVVNPSLIYIRFNVKDDQAATLSKELNIHYSKERELRESWKAGDVCVVAHGNIYTRGKVISAEADGYYKVNLYDQAEEATLPASNMFVYNKYFYKYASIVYKAYLANIKPAGGDTWSLSSVEALEKIFEKYKEIYATKVPGDTSEKSIPMKMWYTHVKAGTALVADELKFYCINNKLVKMGFAYRLTSKLDMEPTSSKEALKPSEKLLQSLYGKTDEESEPEKTKAEPNDWNALVEEEEKRLHEIQSSIPLETISEWLPPLRPKEKEFFAWVTCAETEGILFYRQDCMQEVYKEMEKQIKEYFDKKKPDTTKSDWKVGDCCTIIYNDHYYRGKIFKVDNDDSITAVMIDFGSDHDLTSADLVNELLYVDIPPFVSKVKMDKIYPKCGQWLDSDYQMLLDVITEYSKIVIKGTLDTDMPYAEIYNTDGESINDILVSKCPNLVRYLEKEESDDDVVIEEEVIIESEELITQDVESVDEGKDSNREDVDKDTGGDKEDEGEAMQSNEKVEKEVKEEDGGSAENVNSTLKYKVQALPETSSTFPMNIVSVLEYNQVVLKPIDEIYNAHPALESEIENSWEDQQRLETFSEGIPCIAHCGVTNSWQRAVIHNTKGIECGYVFVFYVDKGTMDLVSLHEVRTVRPEWLEEPVDCRLAQLNIELKSTAHKEHVCQFLKKMKGRSVQVKVVTREPLVVHLVEESGDFMYKSLIRSGMLESLD